MLAPTIPEFSTLPPKAQDQLLEYCLGRKDGELGPVVYATGIAAMLLTRALFEFAQDRGPVWWAFVAVCGIAALACLVLVVSRLVARREREELREAIANLFPDGMLPECFVCRYDLRGTGAGTCPECGAATVLADENGNPRAPVMRTPAGSLFTSAYLLRDRQALTLARKRIALWTTGAAFVLILTFCALGIQASQDIFRRYQLIAILILITSHPARSFLTRRSAQRIRREMESADRTNLPSEGSGEA